MNIIYRHADLLDHHGRFILHGCNAKGKMNSGVAKVIRDAYPRNFQIYEAHFNQFGLNVGSVIVADCGRFVFFNGITQPNYGYDGAQYVDYEALRSVMTHCNQLMKLEADRGNSSDWGDPETQVLRNFPLSTPELAMPLIGAGVGGGDWLKIRDIIEETARVYQPVVYIKEAEQYAKILKLVQQ